VCAESPEVRKRLDRISQNYEELDSILEQLEAKMQADDRLSAFEGDDAKFELTFGIKRKRKWRPTKAKSKSAGRPRKPR
jgi:NH3-dependent NAD+ synthetase